MNTAQTTKNLAKTVAKQIAQEPLEILKDAREQVTGSEKPQVGSQPQKTNEENPEEKYQKELNDNLKSSRRMEAFDRELKDIAKENLFKELQEKISKGEEVYIDEYQELSMEQKQVLKAQLEAIEKQKQIREQNQGKENFLQVVSKRGRRLMGMGQKKAAEKQTTRVEKPIPPSG